MSQKSKIKEMLQSDGWICSSQIIQALNPIIDYRKRLSEIKQSGLDIESEQCRGRCGRNHKANMHWYRIRPKQMSLV